MFSFLDKIEKKDLGDGVVVQELGDGEKMTALRWELEDGALIPMHNHPHEQFGYVIDGCFNMIVGDEKKTLKTGDSYFIPSNVPHEFRVVGKTYAIDVFSPLRADLPWKK